MSKKPLVPIGRSLSNLALLLIGFLPAIRTVSNTEDIANIVISHSHGNNSTPTVARIGVPKRYIIVIAPELSRYISWRQGHFITNKSSQYTICIEAESGFSTAISLSLSESDFLLIFKEICSLGSLFSNTHTPALKIFRHQRKMMTRTYSRLRHLAKKERSNALLLEKEEKLLTRFFELAKKSVSLSL